MELDDLKNTWKEATSPIQNRTNLTPDMLEKTYDKYHLKLKRITIPEIAGSVVCLAAAVFIGLSFDKLDTALLQGTGVLSILLLLLLPFISSLSTRQLSMRGSMTNPHAETLRAFAVQKIRFVKLQKLNVALSYLLLVTIIVLLSKLFSGKDLTGNKYYWLFSFTIGYIFLLFYSKWVEKYYLRTVRQAEELLRELTV